MFAAAVSRYEINVIVEVVNVHPHVSAATSPLLVVRGSRVRRVNHLSRIHGGTASHDPVEKVCEAKAGREEGEEDEVEEEFMVVQTHCVVHPRTEVVEFHWGG